MSRCGGQPTVRGGRRSSSLPHDSSDGAPMPMSRGSTARGGRPHNWRLYGLEASNLHLMSIGRARERDLGSLSDRSPEMEKLAPEVSDRADAMDPELRRKSRNAPMRCGRRTAAPRGGPWTTGFKRNGRSSANRSPVRRIRSQASTKTRAGIDKDKKVARITAPDDRRRRRVGADHPGRRRRAATPRPRSSRAQEKR